KPIDEAPWFWERRERKGSADFQKFDLCICSRYVQPNSQVSEKPGNAMKPIDEAPWFWKNIETAGARLIFRSSTSAYAPATSNRIHRCQESLEMPWNPLMKHLGSGRT